MNRRTFVRALGAAGAAIALRPHGTVAAPPTIGLGFSLYGMKSLPLAAALETCAGIGYRNVELALMPGFPAEPQALSAADRKVLRELLAKHGLSVSGLMDNLSLTADDAAHAANLDRIRAAAELARDLAPESPPVLETVLGGKPAEWDTLRERMASRVRDWARASAEGGITVCLKPHVNSAVNSPERLLWLHKHAASLAVKLCYDFSHFAVQGMDLATTLEAILPETRFIHVKDVEGAPDKVRFLLPGEGRIDYSQYAALLRKHAWSGPVVVEVSAMISKQPAYDPVDTARKCFAALAPKFTAA